MVFFLIHLFDLQMILFHRSFKKYCLFVFFHGIVIITFIFIFTLIFTFIFTFIFTLIFVHTFTITLIINIIIIIIIIIWNWSSNKLSNFSRLLISRLPFVSSFFVSFNLSIFFLVSASLIVSFLILLIKSLMSLNLNLPILFLLLSIVDSVF